MFVQFERPKGLVEATVGGMPYAFGRGGLQSHRWARISKQPASVPVYSELLVRLEDSCRTLFNVVHANIDLRSHRRNCQRYGGDKHVSMNARAIVYPLFRWLSGKALSLGSFSGELSLLVVFRGSSLFRWFSGELSFGSFPGGALRL